MKLYCDYCGSQIDTEKDATCPHCGAGYAWDAELRAEQKREENRLLLGDFNKKIQALKEQEILKDMEKQQKEAKLRLAGKLIVGAISLGLVIYVMINLGIMLSH